MPAADLILVCCGGGGLLAGLATAVKLCRPQCVVMGVEPQTADTMARSLTAEAAVNLASARSIAAGLAPPFAGENAFR